MKVSSVRNLIPVADGSGVTMTSSVVRYGSSTSGTTKPSTWSTSVPTVSQGNYLWSWIHMEFSNNTSTDIYSVSRMGIDGKGVKSSVVDYSQQETSVDPATITDWGDYPSTLIDGYWIYTRTRLTYSDDATTTSYSTVQIGTGSYYAGLQEYYQAGASSNAPDAAAPAKGTYASGQEITIDDNWKQERPTLTAEKPYLWNFEISADSKGNRYVTPAVCIGNFAKGISKIVETYGISAYSKPDKTDAKYPSDISSWTDEQQDAAPTEEKPFQWNRTETTYNDNSVEYHYHVSAVKGNKGDQGDEGSSGADGIQPNLYGYNCAFNDSRIVHTKTGFAGVMNGSDTSYNAQVYHFKDNAGTRFPAGTYALSCKVKVTAVSGMPSAFNVIVGGDHFGSQAKTMTSGSIASFVVKGTCSATTVPWVCIGEYGNASSGITASAKFRIEVTEWKFEDASKIIGTNTKFNGLSDEKVTTRNNILRDALFNKSSLWSTWNGNCKHVDNLLDGQGGVVFNGVSLPANTPMYDILQQNLTGKLKPSTWYTLSYWAKYHDEDSNGKTLFRSFIYPSVGSTNDVCVQDDVVMMGQSDNFHDITTSYSLTSWKKHVITFRTPSTLPSYYQILWRLSNEDTVAHYREFSLCMPKLEECETATDFCTNELDKRGENGSSFNIMSWTDCIAADSWTFYSSKEITDDTLVADIVIYNSYYYLCIEGYTATSSSSTPDNDSTHWKLFQDFKNVATDILLSKAIYTKILEAVEAQIDDLWIKKLQTSSSNGASITIENGLMQVFGKSAKNIEFGVDDNGYAVFKYFDNNGNELYNLGPNQIVSNIDAGYANYTAYNRTLLNGTTPLSTTTLSLYYSLRSGDDVYLWSDGFRKVGSLTKYHAYQSSSALNAAIEKYGESSVLFSSHITNNGTYVTAKAGDGTYPTSLFTGILIYRLYRLTRSAAGEEWYDGILISIANGIIQDRCHVRFYRESHMSFEYKLCNYSNVVYDVTNKTWQNYIDDMNE